VLDGEIAVPDDRGVTHIGHLQDALDGRQPDRLAYFAFDLLYLDGHDLRRCPIEERKALLRRVLDRVRCPRLVFVDHVLGRGTELFEHVRAIGGKGIVSKRAGSLYSGKATRDWRKTKCHATGRFVVTAFQELGPGRIEALHVAEERDGEVVGVGVGQVRFGFAGKGLWAILHELRAGSLDRAGVVPIEPRLVVRVKYFGRHKGGAIRDGVLVAIIDQPQRRQVAPAWSCDTDAVIAAMDAADGI
jgi:bifunctional non-homologous end joining protein LigD